MTQRHESFAKEVKNVEYLQWRSVDGLLVSLASEINNIAHFKSILS
jgi:LacI family transcriptional regulator